MAVKVPITRPDLGKVEAEEVVRVVTSGWITQGPEVAAFEGEFAAAVGAKHAVAVSNCTVALELALRICGVGSGVGGGGARDEVITASHSFIATANAIVTVGGKPVFADVEEGTYGLDPKSIEAAITPRTRAIMCVHQIGIPCDIEGILAVAKKHGLPVIEDAACAIGSEIRVGDTWERIGKPHGTIACFSLHPRKIVTTGDGGMITTSDPEVASRLKKLRQHAMSVPDTVRHHSDRVVFEEYTEPAFNYRMTDLQAAVGRPQLRRLDAIVKERRRLADRYAAALAKHPFFAPFEERPNARSNWQSYPIRLRDGAPVSQIDAMQALLDQQIACKRGISNAHQEPAYAGKDTWSPSPSGLSVSERLRDTTMLIPLFHGMKDEEQDLVVRALESVTAT